MDVNRQSMTDDQFIQIVQDFVTSQEKLKAHRERAIHKTGVAPRYVHYTLTETTLKNFRELLTG